MGTKSLQSSPTLDLQMPLGAGAVTAGQVAARVLALSGDLSDMSRQDRM